MTAKTKNLTLNDRIKIYPEKMEKDWVIVYSTNQIYLAEIAKQVLADNGMDSIIINKKDSSYNDFGDIELYVNSDFITKAKALIKEIES